MRDLAENHEIPSQRSVSVVRAIIAHGSVSYAASHVGLSERQARRLIREAECRAGVDNRYALIAWLVLEGEIGRADIGERRHTST